MRTTLLLLLNLLELLPFPSLATLFYSLHHLRLASFLSRKMHQKKGNDSEKPSETVLRKYAPSSAKNILYLLFKI